MLCRILSQSAQRYEDKSEEPSQFSRGGFAISEKTFVLILWQHILCNTCKEREELKNKKISAE